MMSGLQRIFPPEGTCDWGECDAIAVTVRMFPGFGFLPVCAAHMLDEYLS